MEERSHPQLAVAKGTKNDRDLVQTRLSLLHRLKNLDDQVSWQDFFKTYERLLYALAVKAGLTDAEANDAVQETVITVAKNIAKFQVDRSRGSFKAWLLQIARWRIADQFRKRPQRATRLRRSSDQTSRTSTSQRIPDPASLEMESAWKRDYEQKLFDAAIETVKAKVDPAYFQMFDLRIRKQMPAAKIARQLDVKVAQVYFATYKVSNLIKREVKRLAAGLR